MNKDREPLLGPNTAAPVSILRPDCILCAGEDRGEFLAALDAAGMTGPAAHSKYRCYEFWNFGDRCAILTGIGTGCLEPALWEILQPGIVRRIVLVGTAGIMPGVRVEIGQPYVVDRAWPAGTGIDALATDLPLRPRWNVKAGTLVASSVSTDFYYGFGPKLITADYPIPPGPLHQLYEMHTRQETQLVEMEVAQFYFFCERFGDADMRYAAIKAPANSVSDVDEQLSNSPTALVQAVVAAVEMLT
ncbi:MAG TPA: hypothetical protein VFC46_17690 [Humisphaera sp.]|nr:hypothetical protein [Humisphaera sp.]